MQVEQVLSQVALTFVNTKKSNINIVDQINYFHYNNYVIFYINFALQIKIEIFKNIAKINS